MTMTHSGVWRSKRSGSWNGFRSGIESNISRTARRPPAGVCNRFGDATIGGADPLVRAGRPTRCRDNGISTLPVEFKRTGDAKVELIPASPAVSKDLEGDWEGSIESPNGEFRLVFHFKNQPDHTVAATIESNNAVGMPLNNVKQTGQKVEFGMKIAGGTFEGSLNKEGTELAGQLIHEANSTPLRLRKK